MPTMLDSFRTSSCPRPMHCMSAMKAAHAPSLVPTESYNEGERCLCKYSGLPIAAGVSSTSGNWHDPLSLIIGNTGVRCAEVIKKGQFVDCYIGEVIMPEEADRRREASDRASRKDIYLFALDKFSDPKSNDPRLTRRPLEVDGEFMSGPTRFINHSCDPNLRIFARVGDHADKHLHDLALFAVKDIQKGEELTFDYVDGVADDNESDNLDTETMEKCLCGSAKCRKFLW